MICLMRDLSGMGDDDDAPSGLSQPQEDIHDLIPGMRVEIAGRLISEDHGRIIAERSGDRHTLLLSAGQTQHTAVHLLVAEPHIGQQRTGALPPSSAVHAGDLHGQLDIFQRGQLREQVVMLEDDARIMTAVVIHVHLSQALSLIEDISILNGSQPAHQREQRRLVGAGRADDGVTRAILKRHGDIIQHRGPIVSVCDVFQFQYVHAYPPLHSRLARMVSGSKRKIEISVAELLRMTSTKAVGVSSVTG